MIALELPWFSSFCAWRPRYIWSNAKFAPLQLWCCLWIVDNSDKLISRLVLQHCKYWNKRVCICGSFICLELLIVEITSETQLSLDAFFWNKAVLIFCELERGFHIKWNQNSPTFMQTVSACEPLNSILCAWASLDPGFSPGIRWKSAKHWKLPLKLWVYLLPIYPQTNVISLKLQPGSSGKFRKGYHHLNFERDNCPHQNTLEVQQIIMPHIGEEIPL